MTNSSNSAPSLYARKIRPILNWLVKSPTVWLITVILFIYVLGRIYFPMTEQDIATNYYDVWKELFTAKYFLAMLAIVFGLAEISLHRQVNKEKILLEREKFESEQIAQAEKQKLFERNSRELHTLGDEFATNIGNILSENNNWAFAAMEKAKLGPYSKTLFGERISHFFDEKEHLANEFTKKLLERCKALIEKNGYTVYLVIDSGTTLFPFFQKIAEGVVSLKGKNEMWVNSIKIVTNNLPGVDALMYSGRLNPKDRYSDLAVECLVLPGNPFAVYSATLGEMTIQTLKNLKTNSDDKPKYFIGLCTGNWVRIRQSMPRCPLPLARGGDHFPEYMDGHLKFKQALVDYSDETYIIAPLAKIFVYAALIDINDSWGFKKDHPDPDKRPYKELDISGEKASSIKLVTTKRTNSEAVLFKQSQRIIGALGYTGEDPQPSLNHHLFSFDHHKISFSQEENIEFPHNYTNDMSFWEKFFCYSRNKRRAT